VEEGRSGSWEIPLTVAFKATAEKTGSRGGCETTGCG